MAFRFSKQCVFFLMVLGLSTHLSACASWFQQQEEALDPALKTLSYQAVVPFINTDQGQDMLHTEPLKSRVFRLLGTKYRETFDASREILLPVTQVMEGYVLSEGHNTANTLRSLIMVDPERELLTVVLVNAETQRYNVMQQGSEHPEATELAMEEMYQYADRWAMGQLGMGE